MKLGGTSLGFDSCKNWDLPDGDAQYLAGVPDGTYDFLHSSHCLEHMVDPGIAMANWVRVVRGGGYLVITIPDEELYEHLHWPSRFNGDHKWSFTIYRGAPLLQLDGEVSGDAVIASLPGTRRVGSKPFAVEGLIEDGERHGRVRHRDHSEEEGRGPRAG